MNVWGETIHSGCSRVCSSSLELSFFGSTCLLFLRPVPHAYCGCRPVGQVDSHPGMLASFKNVTLLVPHAVAFSIAFAECTNTWKQLLTFGTSPLHDSGPADMNRACKLEIDIGIQHQVQPRRRRKEMRSAVTRLSNNFSVELITGLETVPTVWVSERNKTRGRIQSFVRSKASTSCES